MATQHTPEQIPVCETVEITFEQWQRAALDAADQPVTVQAADWFEEFAIPRPAAVTGCPQVSA